MYLMPTELAYFDDMYQRQCEAEILEKRVEGSQCVVFLDKTIFYPHGGGQPADHGMIRSSNGSLQVSDVKYKDFVVYHYGKLEGGLEPDDQVDCEIDWERRYWNMRVHTGGHLIHDVLMGLTNVLTPIRADHGSKPFLEYRGELKDDVRARLEAQVNELIAEDRVVYTREVELAELEKIAKFIPPNLPKDKPLRTLQIEGFYAMPDGGTHVRTLSEIGSVEITAITAKEGKTKVGYRVQR